MSLLDRKVRGFRLIDMVALGILAAIVLSVYLAKTMAGKERAEIASIERRIDSERARIRLLQAEVAHLEQPSRIERLSTVYLGLVPLSSKHETTADGLIRVVVAAQPPAPQPVEAPADIEPGAAPETAAPTIPPPPPAAPVLTTVSNIPRAAVAVAPRAIAQ